MKKQTLPLTHDPVFVVLSALCLAGLLALTAFGGSKGDAQIKAQSMEIKGISKTPASQKKIKKPEGRVTSKPRTIRDVHIPQSSSDDSAGTPESDVPQVRTSGRITLPPDRNITALPGDAPEVYADPVTGGPDLKDPFDDPFREEFLDDARFPEDMEAPLPDGVDGSRIPGRGCDPTAEDGPQGMNEAERRQRCYLSQQLRVLGEATGADDSAGAGAEGTAVFCEDHEVVDTSPGNDNEGDVMDFTGADPEELNGDDEDDEVNVGTDNVSVGGGISSEDEEEDDTEPEPGSVDDTEWVIDEDSQGPGITPNTDEEGDKPDEMQDAVALGGGSGDPDRDYIRDGRTMPRRTPKGLWRRNRDEREGRGGRNPDDPGDGPDKVVGAASDGALDADFVAHAQSPAVGGGDGGEDDPDDPRAAPMASSAISMPDLGAALSPAIGDDGKDPDGPSGPEF